MAEHEKTQEMIPKVKIGDVEMAPSQMISWQVKAATQLADMIRTKRLALQIRDTWYIRCEGWQCLASMTGCYVEVESVEETEPGNFLAWAVVKTCSTGATRGRACASCGSDEKIWAQRSVNQRRSMAQTRAMSKALKVAFASVIAMAGGFATTTAEEMETGEE